VSSARRGLAVPVKPTIANNKAMAMPPFQPEPRIPWGATRIGDHPGAHKGIPHVGRRKAVNDTSSDDAKSVDARVTKAGEAISERVQSATAATASAVGRAEKVLDDADEAAQQAWSKAGGVVEDVVDAGRRATMSASLQIGENPLSLYWSAACSAMSRAGGFTDDGRRDRIANGQGGCQNREERMDLILIILLLVLIFGGGFGYSRWGYSGGIGIGGVLLIVLVVYLLLGRGRF
jgi:hypothetical protein